MYRPPPISTLFPYTTLFRSAAVLREFGNLSSPFVLFVLQTALADNAPAGLWWMSSFGAGFSCHGRSEEHTSELQSLRHLVCRLLLEKKKIHKYYKFK